MAPRGSIDYDDAQIRYALDTIKSDYGVSASVQQKLKPLVKFGRNFNVSAT